MQLTSDVERAWKEGGPQVLLTRSLKRLVRPVLKVGTLVFIECDLRKPMPERREIPGIVLREATMEDVDLFEDRALFLKRLREGHRCFMGIEDATGKLTNYRWVNSSAAYIPELEQYLVLRRGEAYVYDLNTLPEFRRRGIDAYTRHCIYSYLRDNGYTKIYAYVHGDNRPSLKASTILLTPTARIRYIQLRGCRPFVFSRTHLCDSLPLCLSQLPQHG
jgi:GNAT superfamily N-acetyltransferase